MASNHISLAFANDEEISAIGFGSVEEAVSYYSDAAVNGFDQCRFVSLGLQDAVVGVEDDDVVMLITGVTQLRAYLGTFGDRPSNLRGWLLFSNCNYFLEELDLVFGRCGGTTIPVDQFMCGADGAPVIQEGDWTFMDYFQDSNQFTLNGITYVKAWDVDRKPNDYAKQNVTCIRRITYITDHRHVLADGTTMKTARHPKVNKSVVLESPFDQIYKEVGSPFMGNGSTFVEMLKDPAFFHALITCDCGRSEWTVGDWKGYNSLCCNIKCKPITIVTPKAVPGAVVITKAGIGAGLKCYNNVFLKHIIDLVVPGTTLGWGVWRIAKVQSKDDVATSGNVLVDDPEDRLDPCYFGNDGPFATKFKFQLLANSFDEEVKGAIVQGTLKLNTAICDVVKDMLGVPWFIKKLGGLATLLWDQFVSTVRGMKLCSSKVLELAKSVSCASMSVVNGVLRVVADVPSMFKSAFDTLVNAIGCIFTSTCDTLIVAGKAFARAGEFVILPKSLVRLAKSKVKGPKQAGLKHLQFATAVLGDTQKVHSSRVEFSTVNLKMVDDEVPLNPNGYTVAVGEQAFFCSDGVYRFMSDLDAVLLEPVFKPELDLEPVFECDPILGFPKVAASNVAELCVKVDTLLFKYDKTYKKYSTIIKGDKCCIQCTYTFNAPSYYFDDDEFVELCEKYYKLPDFDAFYNAVHAATDMDQFCALCTSGFEVFTPRVPDCPPILNDIDGGSIWTSFILSVRSATDFIKSLKIDLGLNGVVVFVAKKFKKAGALLQKLYNAFLDTVTSFIKVAGVAFKYCATCVPKIVINGCYHTVTRLFAKDLQIPTEDGVADFNTFNHCVFPVNPTRIETDSLELEEVDFVEPGVDGKLVILDDYSFYSDGKNYYPSDGKGVVASCFKKKGGGVVTISDEVQVRTIDPVYKVRLEYEFEDETLVKVCEKAIGTKLKVTGDWSNLLETLEKAMDVVRQHLDVPDYFVYDEEGGTDLNLTIMVSQWPLSSDSEDDFKAVDDEPNANTDETVDTFVEDVVETQDVQQDVSQDEVEAVCDLVVKATEEEPTEHEELSEDQKEVQQALAFIEDKPVVVKPDVFAFSYASYGGLKVLNQSSNNCWVSSALIQLQLTGLLDSDEMKLFNAGRVSPMVKRCYESQHAIFGSLGDVSACLESLLKDRDGMSITCTIDCGCGPGVRVYENAIFRFTPLKTAFPMGRCLICSKTLMHTITQMKGTGIFCRDATALDVDTLVVKPLCAAVYVGAQDGGHYLTNMYDANMAVDGHGRHPIKFNTINTLCYKDVDWEVPNGSCDVKPFLTYKNIEFYQGELNALLSVNHDFVVNAANEQLSHGGGIAKALDDLTKGELQVLSNQYVNRNGSIKVGSGVLIKCKEHSILNVVGPRKGKHAAELLTKAYTFVFKQKGVPLMPLLSVGIFKVPITESLAAFLACVGDRVCKCFCYTDKERLAIQNFVTSFQTEQPVEPLPVIQEVKGVQLEKPVPDVKVENPCEPFRIEGDAKFYDLTPSMVQSLQVTRLVSFTNSDLCLGSFVRDCDGYVQGSLGGAIANYKKSNPVLPAGNCVTLKCDGFISFTFVILPKEGDTNYEKNFNRAIAKFLKLKGSLLVVVEDSFVFNKISHASVAGYVAKPALVDTLFEAKPVQVVVTQDQRSFHTVELSTSQTYGQQLGDCVVEDKKVTNLKPVSKDKVVSVVPNVDWDKHYGFVDAGIFHTLDHTMFVFDNNVVNGKRVLRTSDNNCWINAVCLQLQFANAKFKPKGLQQLWESYCTGDVAMFVHWLYWITGVEKGEPSDAENTLNIISRFLKPQGSVEMLRATSTTCDGTCSTKRVVSTPVVNASVLKVGLDDGNCVHGLPLVDRVVSVNGTVIITNVGDTPGKPVVATENLLLDGVSYTVFQDSTTGVGHYTVFDKEAKRMFDGDMLKPCDLNVSPVTSMVVCNNKKVVVQDPVKRVELDASKLLDTMNVASEKFFTVGDFVSRNIIVLIVYLFSLLAICFRALKKRDMKVMAGVPERTGIILKRSVKYNYKALKFFFRLKFQHIKVFLKFSLVLYTLYALMFMFIRFTPAGTPICNQYTDGYANSTFDKNEYCGNVLCKICLYGYEELSDFTHTRVIWQHLKDPLIGNILPLFYLAFLVIFGGFFVRIGTIYFIMQYINAAGVALGYQDNVWLLHLLPFNSMGNIIVVAFIVTRILLFLKHVLFGCDKPSCIACSKSAKLTRVPLQTILQGVTKSFYVNANGGKKFCKKHNFFCVDCDSYGYGCTFINDVIAPELSNVTKLNVIPTGPATIIIDKVEFSNGFYYLYSGSTFWKYNFDITEVKYACKDVLKNCNILTDFVVFNNSGSNVTQVKNACVYFSQLLCKPIKLVDSALLASLNVDFSANLHKAFVEVLSNSFGKDLSNCSNMNECRESLGLSDVPEEEFSAAVSEAHRYDVLISDVSFNNLIVSYAKPEEKLAVHDIANCMRVGAKVVNHNVITKDNVPVVWLAKDFIALSEEARKYIVRTTKIKGVNFMLTFNDRRMHLTIPTISVANKKGAGLPSLFTRLYSFFWHLCVLIVVLFVATSLLDFSAQVTSDTQYDFKYIENGVLKVFEKPLDCVHNAFVNFNEWHNAKFGSTPTNSRRCPIVVGTSDEVRYIPGVPAGVFLYGKSLIFAMSTIFGTSGLCFDDRGLTDPDSCIFNSACTTLSGIGGRNVYCYRDGVVDNAKLYSSLLPHSYYRLMDGNHIVLPEIITRGFGIRTIKTQAMTYCRTGECIDSQAGVCVGLDRFFVYSKTPGSDYVCGTGFFSLLFNVIGMFSNSIPVTVMSGQILLNCVVAFTAVMACFAFTKFKRLFGDMSFGVLSVGLCTVVNNLSYVVTQNSIGMLAYATLYFLCTKGVRYSWVWHVGFAISYCFLAPWWVVLAYLICALLEFLPNLFKLKVSTQLFEGDKFVGSFESAASGTFVLDMHSYQKLANSISTEKLKQYCAAYNRYKYYSGSASEADYRLACFAHLAKAMSDFANDHMDKLYTPPTVSYNSTLQAGLRKMAQPSGVVEGCIVRVSYGNLTLNGLWLGDTVICPRHVIASNTTNVIDYDHAMSLVRLHNFSISSGNMFLGVISASMRGALLHIKVNQSNVNTPNYTYKVLKPGDSFNILACYDGSAAGVYGVNMRTNYTIRGSFISGACGSPGYNINNGVVEFCYMHHLELGSGCHVGSDMDGTMYGKYEDQPTLQIEGASNLITENVCSWLYGALINGDRWWLSSVSVGLDTYNEWALRNGMTALKNVDCFSLLVAKTGVDVGRLLASIQKLHGNFGGKSILGCTSLCDEFTLSEVVKQMYGVTLQSGKVSRAFRNASIVCCFLFLFLSEMLNHSKLFWINPGYITPVFLAIIVASSALMLLVKHKLLFLQLYLLPSLCIVSGYNIFKDYHFYTYMLEEFDYKVPFGGFNVTGVLNISLCCFVMGLHTFRFLQTPNKIFSYVVAVLTVLYTYYYSTDVLGLILTSMSGFTNYWFIGTATYKLATYVLPHTSLLDSFDAIKAVVFLYLLLGYCNCVYYGSLYWINRFCKLTLGCYEFKVSAAEFKYMVANGLRAPTGVFDALILSLKLIGVGGKRTIKISSVQSKLTDLKCANVVLLGCLSNMNIAASSREWAYCVDLHNKINLCNDAEAAQEMLLALLAFFLSKNSAFGVEDLLDSYFNDSSILQSVAATYVNLPTYLAFETARQSYEDALANGSPPQLVKQLRHAMNVAKSEFDREASTQRKLDRMAEQAASQMYKEARAVNRKSKIVSAMHSLLFGMLRRLDMSSVDTILSLAKDGVVPLSIIPAVSATKLNIVVSDIESYSKIQRDGCVHYAGVIWSVIDIKDNDGKPVHAKEVVTSNVESLSWPLFLNCERIIKLQNNEIIPSKIKQRPIKAEGEGVVADGNALYSNEGGRTFMYAFISDKPDLKVVKWEFDGGSNAIELEPPCKFLVEAPSGPVVKYLYFVRNLNNLRRGAVLGFIGATVRLQAGKQTEQATNSSLLTLCAFAVDPPKTYLDAVKSGHRPVGNCIKMLANGSGNGQAITNGVEASTNQDSYGGASVCLYCRAHVEHPDMDGFCKLRGKYVQVPLGTLDPIRFVLENTVCKVCGCWQANGCTCDRAVIQSVDSGYLNECGALVQLD